MKRIFLLVIVGAAALMASAADAWTLRQCIDYALEHNVTVRQRQIDSINAVQTVTEARDGFLPSINAYASQGFSFGRGLTAENTYANRNTSNFGWGADLSLPLFQGLSAVRRLDYSRASMAVALEQLEAARDDVTLNVTAQYLQVLYTRELLEVAIVQQSLSEVELARRRELLAAGKIAELEVIEAESQLAQDRLTVTTSRGDVTLARVALGQLLHLTDLDGFDVAPIDDQPVLIGNADEIYRNALEHNHAVRAADLQVTAADKNITLAQSGYLPRVSLSAGIGAQYYRVSGFPNESFGEQMRHNLSRSLNFSLQLPIFDAFSTRNSVRRARAQRLSAELALDDARTQLFQTIQQAYYQASNAVEKESAAIVARDASKAAFDAMQVKYNYGKANATEYEQARSAYIRACANAVQAHYEALLRYSILEFYNRN